jgi:NTP pyrophosphatase (non-canonical NTP hydrolase)
MAGVTLIKLNRNDRMPTVAEEARKRRSMPAGTPVDIRKRSAADLSRLNDELAKLAGEVTSFAINNRVDEVLQLVRKGDNRAARELLNDPQTYEAYHARMAGERYEAPVTKAAEPDVSGHALTIKKLIETNDMDGLGRLMRSDPAAYATYQHMTETGLTTAYREVAKRQQQSSGLSSIERTIEEGQAKLAALAKADSMPKVAEEELAAAKARLRGIFGKLKSRKDTQVAEARAELAELLGTAEGRAAMYDLAVIGQLAAAT